MKESNCGENVIVRGVPVCMGQAINKIAVVVDSTRDFNKVLDKKDIILIVKNFDPHYDILLSHCAGVVSEIGNLLCHLAIVSRMCNIPSMVGAIDVTKMIKDGSRLTLDAINGILYEGNVNLTNNLDLDEII